MKHDYDNETLASSAFESVKIVNSIKSNFGTAGFLHELITFGFPKLLFVLIYGF